MQSPDPKRCNTVSAVSNTKVRLSLVSQDGIHLENSSDLERAAAARSIADEFSECTILVIELQRCEKTTFHFHTAPFGIRSQKCANPEKIMLPLRSSPYTIRAWGTRIMTSKMSPERVVTYFSSFFDSKNHQKSLIFSRNDSHDHFRLPGSS